MSSYTMINYFDDTGITIRRESSSGSKWVELVFDDGNHTASVTIFGDEERKAFLVSLRAAVDELEVES